MTDESFGCPQCGHRVSYGTPTCGNCGNDLRPYFRNSPLASPTSSASPRAIGLLALLLLLGGGIFLLRTPVDELVGDISDKVEEFQGTIEEPAVEIPARRPTKGYQRVAALVRDLRAGGLPCNAIKIDATNDYIETGSCQSRGTHVQINIYLEPNTLQGAREIFQDWPFDTVHKDNWWVITSRPVAKEVARITGGRFQKSS